MNSSTDSLDIEHEARYLLVELDRARTNDEYDRVVARLERLHAGDQPSMTAQVGTRIRRLVGRRGAARTSRAASAPRVREHSDLPGSYS